MTDIIERPQQLYLEAIKHGNYADTIDALELLVLEVLDMVYALQWKSHLLFTRNDN